MSAKRKSMYIADDPDIHYQRANQAGDAIRNFLIALNSGAIALLVHITTDECELVAVSSMQFSIFAFILSLTCVGISLFLLKARETERRKKSEQRYKERSSQPERLPSDEPDFPIWKHSRAWDITSAVLFALGLLLTMCAIA